MSLSKMQLKYLPDVRDAFATIKVDVKRTHPPDVTTRVAHRDAILIRILRTLPMWNLDVRYTQGLNDLAVVFMTVFTPAIGERLSDDESTVHICPHVKSPFGTTCHDVSPQFMIRLWGHDGRVAEPDAIKFLVKIWDLLEVHVIEKGWGVYEDADGDALADNEWDSDFEIDWLSEVGLEGDE
jgi:hypothetical protein